MAPRTAGGGGSRSLAGGGGRDPTRGERGRAGGGGSKGTVGTMWGVEAGGIAPFAWRASRGGGGGRGKDGGPGATHAVCIGTRRNAQRFVRCCRGAPNAQAVFGGSF